MTFLQNRWVVPQHFNNKVLIIDTLVFIFTYTRVFLFLSGRRRKLRVSKQLLHDRQELALLSKCSEERAHVPNGHVVQARGHAVEVCRCLRGGETG